MQLFQSCSHPLFEGLRDAVKFVTSDEAQYVFASITTVRAILRCLKRDPSPQARDLYAAVLVASVAALAVAATQSQPAAFAGAALQCRLASPLALMARKDR